MLYFKRFVAFAAAIVLPSCTFLGADSQNNAWVEFHNRCIIPISQKQPVDTSGLDPRGPDNIKQRLRAAQNKTDTYWGPKNVLWVLQTNKDKTACKMYARARGIEVHARARHWLDKQYANGTFEHDHHISYTGILRLDDNRSAYVAIDHKEHNAFVTEATLIIVPEE